MAGRLARDQRNELDNGDAEADLSPYRNAQNRVYVDPEFFEGEHQALSSEGFAVYGRDRDAFNHTDLYLASLRSERDSFAKLQKEREYGPAFAAKTAVRVPRFLAEASEPSVIMSTEGLSLLRYADEIDRLRHILDTPNNSVLVILFVRDKAGFLQSYRKQIEKYPGRKVSDDKASVLYAEDDSWIADFDALKGAYEKGFPGRLSIIDYDEEMRVAGNILPAYLNVIGARTNADLGRYFLNVS